MIRNISFALAFSAITGSVLADDITIDPTPFVGAKSRAEVQDDLARFKRSGVNPWSTQHNPLATFKSANSRASVQGEFLVARREVAAFGGEDSGSADLQRRGGRRVNDAAIATTSRTSN